MCASVKDFYNSKKYAILWTVGYVIATWAIMRYMFNFNIFSAYRWHQLMHAHLHGFAGLVFGILILAMIPLYVATTIVIARNNAPLFNFKITIPEFIKTFFRNAFAQPPLDEPQPAPQPESEPEHETPIETTTESETAPQPESEPIPETVPAEMRIAYARARDHITRPPTSAYDLGNITKSPNNTHVAEPVAQPDVANEMPIPTDFDIDDTQNIMSDVPVFTDLDFDDDDESSTETESVIMNGIQTATADNDLVIKYLTAQSVPYIVENDVVLTDAFAIVSHTDSDFWVADNESWFAAGKIRKSPIASVMEIATQHNLQPVLYLGANNIMDIDELRPQWEKSGIRVISDLKDLM